MTECDFISSDKISYTTVCKRNCDQLRMHYEVPHAGYDFLAKLRITQASICIAVVIEMYTQALETVLLLVHVGND